MKVIRPSVQTVTVSMTVTADEFISVQAEMKKRSNIVVRPDETKLIKNTDYSAKQNDRLKHNRDD